MELKRSSAHEMQLRATHDWSIVVHLGQELAERHVLAGDGLGFGAWCDRLRDSSGVGRRCCCCCCRCRCCCSFGRGRLLRSRGGRCLFGILGGGGRHFNRCASVWRTFSDGV
ncbi:hypothetical protein CTA2_12338, partial [Colletotrichum tanaceti]